MATFRTFVCIVWLTLAQVIACRAVLDGWHHHHPRHCWPPRSGRFQFTPVFWGRHRGGLPTHPEPPPPRPGQVESVTSVVTGEHLPSEPLNSSLSIDFAPDETVSVSTSTASNGSVQILPSLTDAVPHTTGIATNDTEGAETRDSQQPLITSSIETPTSLLQPTAPASSVSETPTLATMASYDIFAAPIATGPPPAQIPTRDDHPVARKGISPSGALQTNKFYSNFFLGDQTAPTYTFPYSVAWAAGKPPSGSYGLAVSHIDANQFVFGGPKEVTGAAAYFYNPVGIQSLILSAKELGQGTALTIDSMTAFSAVVRLRRDANSVPSVSFPLVQGMGFVTGLYNGSVPVIQTGVFFREVTRVSRDPKGNVTKFRFLLEDGKTWWLYAFKTRGDDLDLHVINNGYAEARSPFFGSIQVAKDTEGAEEVLDYTAGIYAETVGLYGSVAGAQGSYTFHFTPRGHPNGTLLMYALPHHVESFDAATSQNTAPLYMQTTTKGLATAVLGNSWTMVEPRMPVDMGFAPWSPEEGSMETLSEAAKSVIRVVARNEVSQNMIEQCNLDSMYFSGKALAKFALIIYVINDMLEDRELAQAGLQKLKQAFAIFAENQQRYPLLYERAWGGMVSSASYTTGSDGVDFGNTYYNDHHFHWGYFVLAAAVIGHVEPQWAVENADFVNMLVRDYANPSIIDGYFPQYRCFDWYHGHSWAHGLYASMDGKDQESSSEDVMSAYAIKMWGTALGDANMTARGNLQLAVLARSVGHYYLIASDNTVFPPQFAGNKVAGILFENKADHTTYFGARTEYIQGIHMIPLLAASSLARSREFVLEEWTTYFSDGRVDRIDSAWKGIIYGNYASAYPREAWAFFNDRGFKMSWLDGGASLTWYMAYAAAMGGA